MGSPTKPFWRSKVIIANIVGILFIALGAVGVLPEGLTQESVVVAIMGVINVLSIVFRWGATTDVSATGK